MTNSTAQVLMKKGKRGAAAYIHADCSSGSPQHLGPLLDVLLNPSKAIDEWETIDWCRWLIAGGRTPDEFATVASPLLRIKNLSSDPFACLPRNVTNLIPLTILAPMISKNSDHLQRKWRRAYFYSFTMEFVAAYTLEKMVILGGH
ncbi:hypothetical protein ACJJTC_010589 [Scirpophaga incertulas]